MEEVPEVLNHPDDERAPVVALDKRPVQLLDSVRPGSALAPGNLARRDYEYALCGTTNVFCIVEPKPGRHHTHATPNRKAAQFAKALRRIARRHPAAKTIHLVVDNLNTHRAKSLSDTFGEREGGRLWERFIVHYTPKHGSWLNPAELEASLWARDASPPLCPKLRAEPADSQLSPQLVTAIERRRHHCPAADTLPTRHWADCERRFPAFELVGASRQKHAGAAVLFAAAAVPRNACAFCARWAFRKTPASSFP